MDCHGHRTHQVVRVQQLLPTLLVSLTKDECCVCLKFELPKHRLQNGTTATLALLSQSSSRCDAPHGLAFPSLRSSLSLPSRPKHFRKAHPCQSDHALHTWLCCLRLHL